MPQTDQGFTQLALRMPVGSSLERSDDKVRQVEEIVREFPEVEDARPRSRRTGQGFAVGRNQATLNIALTDRARAQAQQKEVEEAIRDADRQDSRHRGVASASTGRSTSPSSAATPRRWRAWPPTSPSKVKKIPGIADVELSVKPGLPAYAVRLKPGAVRELGLTAPQLGVEPARLRERRGRHLLDHARRRAGRGAAAPAAGRSASASTQMRAAAGGLREGRHADHAATAWPTIEPVFNPEVIRRQDLQRREAIFAGVQGRPAGDVGNDVQKLVEDDAAAARLQLRHRRPDAASRQEAFAAMRRRDGAGGDLHLHRAGAASSAASCSRSRSWRRCRWR